MDVGSLLTPLTYSVSAIILTVFLSQFIIDIRRSSWQRTYRQLAAASIRKHESRSFSVLIHAPQDSSVTIEQIERLRSHVYDKLQVIVSFDSTTSKGTVNALRRYQRANKKVGLRIIKRTQKVDDRSIVRRYASGELVVFLRPGESVSRDFFMQSSIYFMNDTVDELRVRNHLKLDSQLSSTFNAWASMQADMLRSIARAKTAQVVRKQSYLTDSRRRAEYTSKAAILSHELEAKWYMNLRPFITVVLMTGVILGAFMNPNEMYYPFLAALLALILLYVGQLASTAEYSLIDRINLTLMLPFELIYACIYTIFVVPSLMIKKVVSEALNIRRSAKSA